MHHREALLLKRNSFLWIHTMYAKRRKFSGYSKMSCQYRSINVHLPKMFFDIFDLQREKKQSIDDIASFLYIIYTDQFERIEQIYLDSIYG